MDVFGESRHRVRRNFAYERWLRFRPAQERLRIAGDLVKRILQNVRQLQKARHLLIWITPSVWIVKRANVTRSRQAVVH